MGLPYLDFRLASRVGGWVILESARQGTMIASWFRRKADSLRPVTERHRRTRASVDMDDPADTAVTHASSASIKRLAHTEPARFNVSRTTVQVLTVACSTDSSVRGWGPIARHDAQWTVSGPVAESFEDLDEPGIDLDDRAVPVVPEFARVEVRREVTH